MVYTRVPECLKFPFGADSFATRQKIMCAITLDAHNRDVQERRDPRTGLVAESALLM